MVQQYNVDPNDIGPAHQAGWYPHHKGLTKKVPPTIIVPVKSLASVCCSSVGAEEKNK